MWHGQIEILSDPRDADRWCWQRRSHDGAVVLRSERSFRWQLLATRDARRCNPGLDLEVTTRRRLVLPSPGPATVGS